MGIALDASRISLESEGLKTEMESYTIPNSIRELFIIAYKKWSSTDYIEPHWTDRKNQLNKNSDRNKYWDIYVKLRDGKQLTTNDMFELGIH